MNEICDITIVYNPIELGRHYLKCIFKIVHGKPVIVYLIGETLSTKRGCLTLRSNVFEFQPLPIGLNSGITQPIELKNVSTGKVSYDVDLKPLEAFNASNYGFAIMEIQNASGTLSQFET